MEKVVRFSVSVNKDLTREFDNVIKKKGFKNRSNALQEIIRKYINEESTETKNTYILNVYYNHKKVRNISLVENSYPCSVMSSVNTRLDINRSIKIVTLFCTEKMRDKIEKKYKLFDGVEKTVFCKI